MRVALEPRPSLASEVIANPRAVDFYEKMGFHPGEAVPTRFGPAERMRLTSTGDGPRRSGGWRR